MVGDFVVDRPVSSLDRYSSLASKVVGLRVLVVDDCEDSLLLLQTWMARVGLSIDTADNGLDAVRLPLEREYDLIIMDIRMPGLDGCAACKQLRGCNYIRPIVAITACCMIHEKVEIMKSGFDDCLEKPIEWGHLAYVLEGAMRCKHH